MGPLSLGEATAVWGAARTRAGGDGLACRVSPRPSSSAADSPSSILRVGHATMTKHLAHDQERPLFS